LPDEIAEPDRTWIALAAYNVGMGHVYDARRLARELGTNPDLWHDFREVLPLLSQKKYYKDLRYGYARGSEPVRYVQRIRNYHDMLLQTLKDE
jgi:membrane-bound lytic murein transglycosylase F